MAQGLFTLRQVNQAIRQSGWSGTQKTPAVEYLVVAGGGGGGGGTGGGGGAGGLLTGILPISTGSAITVTVGSGGSGGTGTNILGSSGVNSVFGAISTTGGGGGASNSTNIGANGGSGGGASFGAGGTGGNGVLGQGNAGGIGVGASYTPSFACSGGGGAGTLGLVGIASYGGGNGGAGIASSISGTLTAYAGGGGGGWFSSGTAGIGGAGGGGSGSSGAGVAGTANTGGGGGGGSQNTSGGAGGSGIVILSYPDVYAAPTSTTGSPTVSTSGSGSINFNGSSQWITYASNAAWTLGSTFTIEAWVYPTVFSSNRKRICQSDAGFDMAVNASGGLDFNAASTVGTLTLNAWTHVAIVCNSGTLTIYFNGVAQTLTGTSTGINVSATSTLTVGTYQTNSGYAWQGYISNFRIVKNSAVYTSNFTPSTIPLTAITNTQLLLNSNSGAYLADNSTNSFAPSSNTVAGGWNSSSPFATGLGYKNRVYTWTSSGSITF